LDRVDESGEGGPAGEFLGAHLGRGGSSRGSEQHNEVTGLLQAEADVLQAPSAQPRDWIARPVLGGGEPVGKVGEFDVKQFPDQLLLVVEVGVDAHRRDPGLGGDGA
jgi:hypothetical protein